MIVRVACTPDDYDTADRLVSETYEKAGLPVVPSPSHPKVVLLVFNDRGMATGTLTLVFRRQTVVAERLAIKVQDGEVTWKTLVSEALVQVSKRGVQVLAATVKPSMVRRWRQYLGLEAVSRGTYDELGGVPAVVMVGSVDAMCNRWSQRRGESCTKV